LPDDLDGLDPDGIAASSPPIPRKIGAPVPKPAAKDTPLNDTLCIHVLLANL
jgi:hypothetical protein